MTWISNSVPLSKSIKKKKYSEVFIRFLFLCFFFFFFKKKKKLGIKFWWAMVCGAVRSNGYRQRAVTLALIVA